MKGGKKDARTEVVYMQRSRTDLLSDNLSGKHLLVMGRKVYTNHMFYMPARTVSQA
jgi:hypothetical protein